MSDLTFEHSHFTAPRQGIVIAKRDGQTVMVNGRPAVVTYLDPETLPEEVRRDRKADAERDLAWYVTEFDKGCGATKHEFPEGTGRWDVAECVKCGVTKPAGLPVDTVGAPS